MTAVIKALGALAQSSRLEVFRSLVVAGDLKELVHADLVTQERVGRNLEYRAQYGRMNAVLAYLTQNCCQGQACLADAATQCKC